MPESPSPAPKRERRPSREASTHSRFGVARTIASVLGALVGAYAAVVAVARVLELEQNGALSVLDPFGTFPAETVWINVTGVLTFALGLLVALVAAAALLTRSRRLAVVLAVVALLGVVAWVVHHVLETAALSGDGVSVGLALGEVFQVFGALPAPQSAWPFDALTRVLIGPAFLLVAVLAMIRGARGKDDASTTDAPAQTAADPDAGGPGTGRVPIDDPTPAAPAPGPTLYVLKIEEAEYGPYSIDRLRSFADEGRIHHESQVRSTDGGFVPAADIPGLFD